MAIIAKQIGVLRLLLLHFFISSDLMNRKKATCFYLNNSVIKLGSLIITCFILNVSEVKAQYQLTGDATSLGGGCYQFTNGTDEVGAIWNTSLIDLTQAFDVTLNFNFGNNNNGADGMSFIIQSISSGISGNGSGVGYAGISPSLGVVFDDYQNAEHSDPAYDHISLHKNGSVSHGSSNELVPTASTVGFPANIEDGINHSFRFKWVPGSPNGTVQVWFDGILTFTYTGDIITNIFGGNPMVYWGVSASTGAFYNTQKVCLDVVADFSANQSCVGQGMTFTDLSISGLPITSYTWNFGDGTIIGPGSGSSFINPTHIYTSPGNYTVQLTIVNSGGLTSTINSDVTVTGPTVSVNTSPTTINQGVSITLDGTVSLNPATINQPLQFANLTDFSILDNGVASSWAGIGGSFVTSNINASGINPGWSINSIVLNIDHTWDSDVTVYLKSPCGNLIKLITSCGSSNNNFTNTSFSPTASQAIGAGVAPFSATYIPSDGNTVWATLAGCGTPNGTWSLLVGDLASGDIGILKDWTINFNNSIPVTYTYEWTPINISNTLSPVVTPNTTTTYVLTGTDMNGCTASSSVVITVNSVCPVISPAANANNPIICIGDIVPALSVDDAAVGYQINWYSASSGGAALASNTNTYTPSDVAAGTYTYYAEVEETISGCKSIRVPVVLTINALPTITCPPAFNVAACNGAIPSGANTPAAFIGLGGATNGTAISYSDAAPTTLGCIETTIRTYTATLNICTQTCTQTITRTLDNTNPTASNPTNIVLAGCNGSFPAADIAVVTDEADNCGVPTLAFVSDGTPSLVGYTETTIRTYSVTDACGNSINVAQNLIRTLDNTKPTASNPLDITLAGCNGSFPAADITVVTDEADNCGVPTVAFVSDGAPSLVGCTENTIRTFSVTDPCGNSINVTQNLIRTIDNTNPTASSPANIVLSGCNGSFPAANIVVVTDEADNCGVPTVAFVSDGAPNLVGSTETTIRTYSVTDACGNSINVTQNLIRTIDNTNPTASNPANIVLSGCNGSFPAANIAVVIDEADNSGVPTVAFVSDGAPNLVGCTETTLRTYSVTDACGNSINVTQNLIRTLDDTAPAITLCPANQTFCSTPSNTYTIPQLIAADNCSGALSYSYSITGSTTRNGVGTDASGNFAVGVSTITWIVTDACGNLSTCNTTVSIDPIPVLTLVSITCSADLSTYDAVFASSIGTITTSAGTLSGSTITGITSGTNIIITLTNNGCVTPLNITAPICVCPTITPPNNANNPVICLGAATPALTVDIAPAGHQINWYATSSGGAALATNTNSFNSTDVAPGTYTYYAEVEETLLGCKSSRIPVVLTINSLPTITCPSSFNVAVCNGAIPDGANSSAAFVGLAGATNGTAISYSDAVPITLECSELTVRTYTATLNTCTSTCTQILTRTLDNNNPTASNPANITLSGCNGSFPAADITVVTDEVDNCGIPTVTFLGDGEPSIVGNIETIIRTYSVTDACGNNTNVSQILMRTLDNTVPTITSCPVDQNFCSEPSGTYNIPVIIATDNFAGTITYAYSITGATTRNGIGSNASGTLNVGISTISWSVTDACGNLSNCITTVTVTALPLLDLGLDIKSCPSASSTFTATGGSYLWNTSSTNASITVNPAVTTTYSVTVTNSGCSAVDTVIIFVNPLPSISAGPDQTICQGEQATLTASGGSTYNWSNANTSQSIIVTPMMSQNYMVTVNENGCTNVDTVAITVNPSPHGVVVADNRNGCAPLSTSFSFNGDTNVTNYLWNLGNGITSISKNPSTIYVQDGFYDLGLIITNNFNCSTTFQLANYIYSYPIPEATFTFNPPVGDLDHMNISFDGSLSETNIIHYVWNFGDESQETRDLATIDHLYQSSGNYDVTLMVANKFGCLDSISQYIELKDYNTLFLPNSFTPNGDGINDSFGPKYHGDLAPYKFSVYNRWGMLMFSTTNPEERWNGSLNNEDPSQAHQGAYYWIIKTGKGVGKGAMKSFEGSVTIAL